MAGKRNIWILAVLLAVLLAANWALSAWNDRQEERKAREAEEEKIYLLDGEEIQAFSYTDGESSMSFTKEDGQWYYDGDREVPMNQSVIQDTADGIAGMTAVRKLEDPDALEDYGLDEPAYTIGYRDSGGMESAVYIGNGAGENYYATVGDTGTVYTVSSEFESLMQFDLSGLAQYDTVPSIGSGNLTRVTVSDQGTETVYEEEDQLGELAGGFGTLALTDCEDYHADPGDLAAYGLDEASRTVVTAEYTDSDSGETKEFLLYVGSADDTGENRYVMTEDSNFLYRVSDSVIRNLMTVDETEEEES